MKTFAKFLSSLIHEVQKDEVIAIANELSYKLLMALFPFIIFLLTILGFFNIDETELIDYFYGSVPKEVLDIIGSLIEEVINKKNVGLLSTSLLIAIYSASSGFNSVIRAVNKSYGQRETRSFLRVRLLSFGLVIIFTLSIVTSLVFIVVNANIIDKILVWLGFTNYHAYIHGFATIIFSLAILLLNTMVIYKLASCKRISYISVFPGAFCTVVFWALSSKLFTVYITHFANYSKVYGSIGSVVILIFWLNLISVVFLLGSEINALLQIKP